MLNYFYCSLTQFSLHSRPIVTYDLLEEGINFNMPANALTDPPESEVWTTIKLRTSIRYFHHKPKA